MLPFANVSIKLGEPVAYFSHVAFCFSLLENVFIIQSWSASSTMFNYGSTLLEWVNFYPR